MSQHIHSQKEYNEFLKQKQMDLGIVQSGIDRITTDLAYSAKRGGGITAKFFCLFDTSLVADSSFNTERFAQSMRNLEKQLPHFCYHKLVFDAPLEDVKKLAKRTKSTDLQNIVRAKFVQGSKSGSAPYTTYNNIIRYSKPRETTIDLINDQYKLVKRFANKVEEQTPITVLDIPVFAVDLMNIKLAGLAIDHEYAECGKVQDFQTPDSEIQDMDAVRKPKIIRSLQIEFDDEQIKMYQAEQTAKNRKVFDF